MNPMTRLDTWQSMTDLEQYAAQVFGGQPMLALYRIAGNRYRHLLNCNGRSFQVDSWHPFGRVDPLYRICDEHRREIWQEWEGDIAMADWRDEQDTRRAASVGVL